MKLLSDPGSATPSSLMLRLSLLVLGLALAAPVGILAAPGSAATAPPGGRDTAPASGFSTNLYQKGDFVSQYTRYWCIGASMQMMLNIMDAQDDRTARTQLRLQNLARNLSGPARDGF